MERFLVRCTTPGRGFVAAIAVSLLLVACSTGASSADSRSGSNSTSPSAAASPSSPATPSTDPPTSPLVDATQAYQKAVEEYFTTDPLAGVTNPTQAQLIKTAATEGRLLDEVERTYLAWWALARPAAKASSDSIVRGGTPEYADKVAGWIASERQLNEAYTVCFTQGQGVFPCTQSNLSSLQHDSDHLVRYMRAYGSVLTRLSSEQE